MGGETAGVRHALVESMLRLSCRDSVLADVCHSLGPVPADQAHAYNLTRELYGTTRMLLACLSKADLAKVGLPWHDAHVQHQLEASSTLTAGLCWGRSLHALSPCLGNPRP